MNSTLNAITTAKSLALVGLGNEAKSSWQFLHDQQLAPDQVIIADEQPLQNLDPLWQDAVDAGQATFHHLGTDEFQADVVIKTPGIPQKKLSELYQLEFQTLTSNMQLFFDWLETDHAPGQVVTIGVTGTKGKSTTTAVIHHLLKTADRATVRGGNIGVPALNVIPAIQNYSDEASPIYVTLEMSSHQLAELTTSPQVAVIQTIVPEHLDYYTTFEAYLAAKTRIVQSQTADDLVIYTADSPPVATIANQSPAEKISFSIGSDQSSSATTPDIKLAVNDNHLTYNQQPVLPIDQVPLKGHHNLYNLAPGLILGRRWDIPWDTLAAGIKSFQPLPHRLEHVATINGISYYNDSLATNPEATIGALEAFADQPVVLLAGGFDRGQQFEGVAAAILKQQVPAVALFPPTGQRIAAAITNQTTNQTDRGATTTPTLKEFTDMGTAVTWATNQLDDQGVVLLSPGAASFGLFKNYAQRGEAFRQAVRSLSTT